MEKIPLETAKREFDNEVKSSIYFLQEINDFLFLDKSKEDIMKKIQGRIKHQQSKLQ